MIEFDKKLSKLLDDLLESRLSAVKDASDFILKFITENKQMKRTNIYPFTLHSFFMLNVEQLREYDDNKEA